MTSEIRRQVRRRRRRNRAVVGNKYDWHFVTPAERTGKPTRSLAGTIYIIQNRRVHQAEAFRRKYQPQEEQHG